MILQAHEVVKIALNDLVLIIPNPGGSAFPLSSVLTEPPHLRMDKSRPCDIMALGGGVHNMDSTIDIDIASRLTKSCLNLSCKSSDYVLKVAKVAKFGKDMRLCYPIASSSIMGFIPLALNHMGLI